MKRIDEALNRVNEAMRIGYRALFEALSYRDAVAIFAKHGVDVKEKSPAEIKAAFRKLAMALHPDRGGDAEEMKMLTAAFSTLEKGSEGPAPGARYSSRGPFENGKDFNPDGDTPDWANVGWNGGMRNRGTIRREDYTDLNYFKRQMWELSGHSKQRWTIWTFDGSYFRACVSVFGSPAIFPEMAKAVLQWEDKFYRKNAVFVSKDGMKELLLIWLDGENISPPEVFRHDSFNANPGNDQSFVRSLPEMLAAVKNRQQQIAG